MPRTDYDETYDQQGNLVSRTARQVPLRVVSDAELAQIKQTLKTMIQTFYPGKTPTGNPTNAQLRNWLIALTGAVQYLANVMDDE